MVFAFYIWEFWHISCRGTVESELLSQTFPWKYQKLKIVNPLPKGHLRSKYLPGPVTIMDRLVVNTYKGVVPNWCFTKVGKLFFKIQKWPCFDKLFSEGFLYSQSQATSSELRLPCKGRLMSWPVREIKNSTNSFHVPLLWGSRYCWIHFAFRARLKLCKSSI